MPRDHAPPRAATVSDALPRHRVTPTPDGLPGTRSKGPCPTEPATRPRRHAPGASPNARPASAAAAAPFLGNKRESRPAIRRSGSRAKSASEEGRVRRQRRYALREESWEHSSIRRVRLCGRVRARRADGRDQLPEIRAVDEGTCYWSGVARCGSVWACPVCSPKIRHERALEVRPGCRRGSPKATASCS